MIMVSYTVRADDRMGYMEDHVKRFNSMTEVFNFLKKVGLSRRVEGKVVVGAPMVEDDSTSRVAP